MTLDHTHLLICRTDNIGDVALTLPVAGYLRYLYPTIKISFLCRGYAAPLVRYCSAIDQVAEVERLRSLDSYFVDSRFDAVIFARPDKHVARAAMETGVGIRVGTSHRWFHWLYCNRLAHFSRANSNLHEAQLNFKLLYPLGIDLIPELAAIPPLYLLRVPAYPGPIHLSAQCFNLILHPKSNGNGREWPASHYTALARLLLERIDVQIWVTGTQNEGNWIHENEPDLLRLPNVRNMCGRFELDELIRFIEAADGLVASGTGPLHISAALGKPTLGLFPPTRPIDPVRWGAIGRKAETLCSTETCQGCKNSSACRCMNSIAPAQVAEVICRWLASKNSLGA